MCEIIVWKDVCYRNHHECLKEFSFKILSFETKFILDKRQSLDI